MKDSENTSPLQVQVKFITRHSDLTVAPAPILVPSNLKRYGLSQIVNHLLDTSLPIPFDFLINGAFLRSALDAYFAENGLSSESVITLEYLRAAIPPTLLSSFLHDDWVSSVSTRPEIDEPPLILSGSYDGIARLWNLSGQVVASACGHTSAIKSVKWIDEKIFLTSSIDHSIRMWNYFHNELNQPGIVQCVAEFVGHRSAVENIAALAESNQFLTASSDGTIGVWRVSLEQSPSMLSNTNLRSKKRKVERLNPKIPQFGSLGRLAGHSGPVAAIQFAERDQTVAYSVSWDHTIRTWDITTMTLVETRTTQHPILSICSLRSLSLIACGTSARHITLHDPRTPTSAVSTATLRGHANSVVALSSSTTSEWQMVSSSHDGTVRIWDIRASHSGNIFTINRGGQGPSINNKVFDVEWSSVGIVSGGEDRQIHIDSTTTPQETKPTIDK